jgi:hypothetical protein
MYPGRFSFFILHKIRADPDLDQDPIFQFDEDPAPDPTTRFSPDLDPPVLQQYHPRLPVFHFDIFTKKFKNFVVEKCTADRNTSIKEYKIFSIPVPVGRSRLYQRCIFIAS